MKGALDPAFLSRPLAHRGYHDRTTGVIENSLAAARAAIAAGYGIECDVQLSKDGKAFVFHDYALKRLTGAAGVIGGLNAAEIAKLTLSGSTEKIPTLEDFLACVNGQVPLLIELKDQDGAMGPKVGPLEKAVAAALARYKGKVAVMSFNPHSIIAMADLAPGVARGLTTSAYRARDWAYLPEPVRRRLRGVPDYDRSVASFISHEASDLPRKRVAELKAQGAAILCWTIRSPEAEAAARQVADNITFESYRAK